MSTEPADQPRVVLLGDQPAPRPGLLVEEVGDELVIFDPDTRLMHRLDPRACLVWHLLDGVTPLSTTCDELAEGLAVPLDQVQADVTAMVSDLAERGLVVPRPGAPDGDYGPQALEADSTPGALAAVDDGYWVPMRMTGCVEVVTRLGWAQTIGVELDGRAVGIRVSSPELADAVRTVFGRHVVPAADGTFPNLSVRDPESGDDDRQELGRVYRHCTLVARPAERAAVLAALVREAEGELAPYRDGAVRFHGSAILVDGSTVVLAPAPAWQRLLPHSRRLREAGVELLARDVVIDAASVSVVVPATSFAVDHTLLGSHAEALTTDQRYPMGGWLFETGQEAGLPVAAGRAALIAQGAIVNGPQLPDGEALSAVTSVLGRVPAVTYVGEWRSIAEVAGDCVRRV